jgi:D-alanyl-D-alanine carboxypeptidase (penicillin-binding protein 5/6)
MRVLLSLVALLPCPAFAQPQFDTEAPIAYLVDLSSGAVLVDKRADKRIPPASMAKMMTVYVAFDLIDRGQLSLEQKFTVSKDVWVRWNNTGSTMFLKAGQQVRVTDLLHGVVTLSGNDASAVLAEGIAGSEPAFVQMMNNAATSLNMRNSRFGTSNGWPDNGRTVTTAKDLALLGQRTIQDFPELYRKFYGYSSFSWNGIRQSNRNPIFGKVAGADGLKTGHTGEAGYCFAGTAEQNGRRLMMVVAGLPSMAKRGEESVKLLNWGFNAWQNKPLFREGSRVATLPVQLGTDTNIAVVAPRSLSLTLPARQPPRYRLVVRYNGPVKAPFEKGTELAQLVAKFENGDEQIMPLVAARPIAETGYFGRAWNGARSVLGL